MAGWRPRELSLGIVGSGMAAMKSGNRALGKAGVPPRSTRNARRSPQMRDYGSTSDNLSMVTATLCLEREAMQINTIQYRRSSDEGQIFNTAITLAVLALMCALVWLLAIGG